MAERSPAQMVQAKVLGQRAEQYFARLLLDTGYAILARNYYVHRVGEIDLIANRGRQLHCIEVKARTVQRAEELTNHAAEQAATSLKRLRLQRCMQSYLSEYHCRGYETIYLLAVYYVDRQACLLWSDCLPYE